MAGTELLAVFLGAAMMLGGLALLMLAWRRRRQARVGLIVGGWALVAISLAPWAIALGADKGAAIAIAVLSLAAFAIIMRNGMVTERERTAASDDDIIQAPNAPAEHIPWLRRSFIVLLAGPIAAASAMALGLAAFAAVATAEADKLALAAYLTPLVWGLLAVWAVADPKLLRKTAGVVGVGLLGALVVLIVHPTAQA